MKKILFIGLISLLIFACKSNPAKQLDNKTEARTKGTWSVSFVTYAGSDYIKA